jgi:hypothetical protein
LKNRLQPEQADRRLVRGRRTWAVPSEPATAGQLPDPSVRNDDDDDDDTKGDDAGGARPTA